MNVTIKEAREIAGLTQKAASNALHVPLRTFQSWESGERRPPEYVERMIIKSLLRMCE